METLINTLSTWIAHLVSVPGSQLAMDQRNMVASDRPSAGGSVTVNAGNGCDQPLKKIFIPDLLARWPFPRRLNHHHSKVCAESFSWLASFKAFSPKAQQAFDRCNFSKTWLIVSMTTYSRILSGLLGCLAYPIAGEGKPHKIPVEDLLRSSCRTRSQLVRFHESCICHR